MMEPVVAVIYRSKYGSTRRYAHWIAEDTGADLYTGAEVDGPLLDQYDVIVYGGGLYAAGIQGLSLIKNNWPRLRDRPVLVFGVGMSPVRPETVEHVRQVNLTPEMAGAVEFFLLRGAFDYSRLSRWDRLLMLLLKMKVQRKKPDQRTADDKGLLAAYGQPLDFCRQENVEPLVRRINEARAEARRGKE